MATEPWAATLDGHLDQAWGRLRRGVADRRAPARHPVFATVGIDGAPEARTVALRSADRAAGRVEVHTDTRSAKVAQLKADPRAALHVWEPRALLQIRLRLTVRVLEGAEVLATWDEVPQTSRPSYGVTPAPGTPIAGPHDYDRRPDAARFAVLEGMVDEIETVHLGEPAHTRALFRRADGWRGRWLAP